MKLDAVGHLLVGEARDALTRLGVPQPTVAVITTADKLCALVVEADIANSLCVACKVKKEGGK